MIPGIEKLLPAGEIAAFQAALQTFSDRCIRVRVDRRAETLPMAVEPVPWFQDGFWIVDAQTRPGGKLAFAAADYYVQDAASLLPLRLLDTQPDDRVCDLCAAPGGKASSIAERLGPDGYMIANETIRSRLDVLRHNLARTGRANHAISCFDPELLELRCSHLFNKVLVDVPCSGQTLLGKGRHDASALRPKHIEMCASRGRRILAAAARMLEPSGLLVYSTCTFAIEENESQIEWLCREFPDAWETVDVPELSAWRSPLSRGCYRLWPHRDRCRGGFAAVLRKVGEMPTASPSGPRRGELPRRGGKRTDGNAASHRDARKRFESSLHALGAWPMGFQVHGASATASEPGLERLLGASVGADGFHPTLAAVMVGQRMEPTHALALADSSWFVAARDLELDEARAAAFATGNALPLQPSMATSNGAAAELPWVRALWRGKPLGWLKASAHRWNNELPAWARLNLSDAAVDREPE